MLNLDTHVLLHALGDKLPPPERSQLEGDAWGISAIVLWELGRIEIDLDDPALTRALARVHVWPLTLDVCRTIRTLDFRGASPSGFSIANASVSLNVPMSVHQLAGKPLQEPFLKL